MALIKCHECGNEVSTEAVACPKCGAKPKFQKILNPPKKTSKSNVIIWVVIGLSVVIFMKGCTDQYHDYLNRMKNEKENMELHIDATINDGQLVMQSNQDFPLKICNVNINSEYKNKIEYIEKRGLVHMPLNEFTTSDGNRFNEFSTKVQSVEINCKDTPNGNMYGRLASK